MKKPNIKSLGASFTTRSFRAGGYSVMATALVIAIAIMVNLLVSSLPKSLTQFDTTSNDLFTLSQQSLSLSNSLEEDVTIYWIVRSGQEQTYLEGLLEQYKSAGDHIRVVKKDPDVYPTFPDSYTSSYTENSLIVTCGNRYRYVDYNDIFVMDYSSYYYYGTTSWSFDGESQITSAIDYVTREDLPTVYQLTGHGESTLSTTFSTAINDANIQVQELSLLTQEGVPTDADALLINTPQSDISENEGQKIQEYLGNGGKLLLITDPPQSGKLTNLESLLETYGVTAQEGIVVEGDSDYYVWGTPYYLLPQLGSHTVTSPLSSSGYRVMLPISEGLTVSDSLPETVTVTKLLTTSDEAFSKVAGYDLTTYEKEEGDIDGPFALGVAISQEIDDGITAEIFWYSSGALVDDSSNSMASGGNLDLFLNTLNYLCGSGESSISIHAKSLDQEYLTLDSSTASALTTLVLVIIPAGCLALGIFIWVRRKRK